MIADDENTRDGREAHLQQTVAARKYAGGTSFC
jgi:hypothetical protein